jgi:hypothetical protein
MIVTRDERRQMWKERVAAWEASELGSTDLRKSIDDLVAIVQDQFHPNTRSLVLLVSELIWNSCLFLTDIPHVDYSSSLFHSQTYNNKDSRHEASKQNRRDLHSMSSF